MDDRLRKAIERWKREGVTPQRAAAYLLRNAAREIWDAETKEAYRAAADLLEAAGATAGTEE